MADPRNTLDFSEIDNLQVTLKHDASIVFDRTLRGGSAQVDLAVRLITDKTVALTIDASHVYGKLIAVESDGNCVVQVEGFCDLPGGTGATFTLGAGIVGAVLVAAGGYIRGRAAATLAEVAVARGQVIDDNTATAILVHLK